MNAPVLVIAAVPALLLFGATVRRPALGAWLLLGVGPLIVGIARGAIGLPMRPNEMLVVFVLCALGVRTLLLMLAGTWRPVPFGGLDLKLLALATIACALPLTWRALRGYGLSQDDVLYSVALLKYYAVYRIIRVSVSTSREVGISLAVAMAASVVVGVLAMLQVTDLLGVPEFLHRYYDQPFEGAPGVLVERGTSTIASAFGLADMMIMSLVLALALRGRMRSGRPLLLACMVVYLGGCLVAGEFSGYVGVIVAVLAFGALSRTLHRLIPAGLAATTLLAIPFWAVLARRLAGFESQAGVPHSWQGRWQNLERFFLPDLFSGLNWVFGVRPAPRVPAPEAWREWVYIESGYVWLLWVGGIPLLLAFGWFVAAALSALRAAARRPDACGAAAASAFSYTVALLALMLADPHLTIRGGADLFFPLLALAFVPERRAAVAPAVTYAAPVSSWQQA